MWACMPCNNLSILNPSFCLFYRDPFRDQQYNKWHPFAESAYLLQAHLVRGFSFFIFKVFFAAKRADGCICCWPLLNAYPMALLIFGWLWLNPNPMSVTAFCVDCGWTQTPWAGNYFTLQHSWICMNSRSWVHLTVNSGKCEFHGPSYIILSKLFNF